MNTISDQIMEGMKTAMKAKDSVTLNTLRALKTALTNTAIAKGGLGTRLEEAEELAVVRKQIKQREDSAEEFRASTKKDMGQVMKLMQERTAGRVNGKELARMVSARLL